MATFYGILEYPVHLLGRSMSGANVIEADRLRILKALANDGLQNLAHEGYPWAIRDAYIDLTAAYTTGTLAATQYDKNFVGTGTVWTAAMVTRLLIVGGHAYTIASRTDNTHIATVEPYADADASGLTYSIVVPWYYMPRDYSRTEMYAVRLTDSSPLDFYSEAQFDEENGGTGQTGKPTSYRVPGTTATDYYNTGTVTISSTAVTGVGTTFVADHVSRMFRVAGETREYIVSGFTDGTHIAITPSYVNPASGASTLAVASSYAIDPAGLWKISFWPYNDYNYGARIRYLRKMPQLVNDNDVPDFPGDWHDVLKKRLLYEFVMYESAPQSVIALRKGEYNQEHKKMQVHYYQSKDFKESPEPKGADFDTDRQY